MSTRLPIARLTSMRCRPQFASTFGAGADVADDVVDARIGRVAVDRDLEITGRVLVRRALRRQQARAR